jgi:peptide/nickel transport system permease protein
LGWTNRSISIYRWIGALRGDFGVSYFNQFSVTELLNRKLWATVELSIAALLLSLVIAIRPASWLR